MHDEQKNEIVDHFVAIASNTNGSVFWGLTKGLVNDVIAKEHGRLRALFEKKIELLKEWEKYAGDPDKKDAYNDAISLFNDCLSELGGKSEDI